MTKSLADDKKLIELRNERTLVLLKPDAVKRQIVGELVTRFERKGLKICGMKMVMPTEALAGQHYTDSEEWLKDSGERTYNSYVEKGIEPPMSARDLALNTRRKLMGGLTAGPLVALVLQGAHVIEIVRKMRGATSPQAADVGTIGFDYSVDSYELADAGDWPIRNIIHASDSTENAEREINIWFSEGEVLDYTSAIEHILYSKEWSK
jgi:nucleoside-diphosphate kinase